MEKITTSADLQERIFALQQKKEFQRRELENEFESIHENLSVSNIFKSTLHSIIGGENVKTKAASSAIGLGTGMIAQRLVSGGSKNIFRKLLGTIVQIAVTGLVVKNSDKIATKSAELGKKVFG